MKQNKEKWWIVEFLPLILLWAYVLSTLIMFRFGLIRWTVAHVNLVVLYVLMVYLSFSVGYTIWTRRYKRKKKVSLLSGRKEYPAKIMLWFFRFGAIMSIIFSGAWLNQFYGASIVQFINKPGAAYDLSNFLGDLYAMDITPYPMWFRWVSRINTVFSGIKILAVCFGVYQLKYLRIYDKLLFFSMLILNVAYAWLFGKQSLFMILALEIVISLCARCAADFYREKSEKTLWQVVQKKYKDLLACVLAIILLLAGMIALIVVFQNDRVVQRNLRKSFYLEAVEKTGPRLPTEQLEYFVLKSVQKRTGYSIEGTPLYDVVLERYGEYMEPDDSVQSPDSSETPGTPSTPSTPGTPSTPETPPSTTPAAPATLNDSFVGLSGFYKAIDLPILPGAIRYGIQTVEMYVTQGYASMALAFDLDFQWSKFVGNSIYLSHLVDKLLGSHIAQQTYTARNEEINGWSESVYLNTLYTWLASDITFLGVIVLFFFWGLFFSNVWMEIISENFLFALPLCYQFAYALLFAPANNFLLNTLGEILKTGMVVAVYIGGRILYRFCTDNRMHNPRKLVFVIGNMEMGGAAKMLAYTANISSDFFKDITILSLRKSSDRYQLRPEINVLDLELPFSKPGELKDYYFRYKALRNALHQLAPDIIIAFVNPIIIYSYFAKPSNTVLIGADRGNPEALPAFHKILSRFVYPRCSRLVFQTDNALSSFGNAVKRKSYVIENPFVPTGNDPGIFQGKRKKTIVSTSRLDRDKNIDVLIRAFAQSRAVHDYVLQIYGDGECRDTLSDLVSELKLTEKVLFMGSTKDVMCEIADAGMFVLVSKHEGMPNGLIEAMALGIPCIATNCMANGSNSLIEDRKNGLIVKIDDVEDLANAINLYCTEPEYRELMGYNGTQIRKTLEESTIRQKWNHLFAELTEGI